MWESQLEKEEYEFLEHNVSAKAPKMLTKQDYKNLIDLALDKRDFEWARSLSKKMTRKFGGK